MIFDVVIVGGGVVGLTLAALIAESGLKILVIEKNLTTYVPDAGDAYDLRCSALNLQSCQLFEKLAVLPQILASANYGIFKQIAIYAGASKLQFAASEINASYLGYILQNKVINNVLLDYLQQQRNVTLLASNVVSIDRHANQLFLSDHTVLEYKLLVLADGRQSNLRQLLGVELYSHDYHDSAIVATVKTSIASPQVASQFFADQAILAFLPLAEANYFSIVLSQDKSVNEQLLADKSKLGYILSEKSAYNFGKVEVISQVASFPLIAQHAKNYVIGENIVLVGDSAHSIHPLAGQGLNLGLADVHCLAKFINCQQLRRRDLRQYERSVKLQNSIFMHSMSMVRRFFQAATPAHFATELASHLPYWKAILMQSAVYGFDSAYN